MSKEPKTCNEFGHKGVDTEVVDWRTLPRLRTPDQICTNGPFQAKGQRAPADQNMTLLNQ